MKPVPYITLIAINMIFPVVLHFVKVIMDNQYSEEYMAKWFTGNAIYMAFPHLIAFVLLIPSELKRSTKVISLMFINVALFVFSIWIWSMVPVRESGMAWNFYIPFVAVVLLCLAVIYKLVGYSCARS